MATSPGSERNPVCGRWWASGSSPPSDPSPTPWWNCPPATEIGEFIAAVYNFDETRVVDVAASHGGRQLRVDAGPLRIRAAVGVRTRLGALARLVPRPVAVHPQWLRAISPLAARLSPGARTAGAAKGRRQEYYGVTDLHRIDSASVGWNGGDAGELSAIRPAVAFGFSSVPPEPSLARVRTTVLQPAADRNESASRNWRG